MRETRIQTDSRRYYGYVIVAAGFVIQGTIVGAIFTYSVFFDALQVEFGWSRAVISGASSLTSLVMGFGAMMFGRLSDKIGPRRILSVAGISITAGYFLMSRISSPWQLYVAYALFVGAGFGTHDVVTLSAVARWFGRRRGQMSAFVKAGTGTGQVIGPPAAAALIALFGWRSAYLWIAAATGPLVILAAQLMRRDPSDLGTPHYDRPADEEALGGVPPARARDLMRMAPFRRICIAQLAVFFCMPLIIVHLVPYATDLGIPRALAAGVLSVVGGVSIAGRLVFGGLVDKIGGRRTLICCYGILLIAFILLQFASTAAMLYVFAVVYGFAHGGIFTTVSPLMAEIFGTRSHGLLYGTSVFVGTLSGAAGPTVAGAVFDLVGSYRPVFLLLIGLVLIAIWSIGSLRT